MGYKPERWYFPRPQHCPTCHLSTIESNAYCARCGHDLIGGLAARERRRKTVRCIYCEAKAKRSVEDIFPSWLTRHFRPPGSRRKNVVRRAFTYQPFEQSSLFVAPTPRDKQREIYKLTTDVICEACNNGWMSRLQADAKPILLRLIENKNLALHASERAILSRWAAMTFTNIGFAEQQPSAKQHQRTTLLHGDMPSGWCLGIGLLADNHMAGAYERYSVVMHMGSGNRPFTDLTGGWLAIENLVFGNMHALADQLLPYVKYYIGVNPEEYLEAAGLSLLWPSSEQIWIAKEQFTSQSQLLRLRLTH